MPLWKTVEEKRRTMSTHDASSPRGSVQSVTRAGRQREEEERERIAAEREQLVAKVRKAVCMIPTAVAK